MKFNTIQEQFTDADGRVKIKYKRQRQIERGDNFLVTSNPGGIAFRSIAECKHWNAKADGEYPVIISIDFIDEPHSEVVVHLFVSKPRLNSTEMTIHRMSLDYFNSRRFIFDHLST